MLDLLFLLLLVVAIAIGYGFGRRDKIRRSIGRSQTLSKEYFAGLNFLLNEQTDQAIDVFFKALDKADDSVETYLALGALLAKQGEIEKSIRVHQTLLARPSLSRQESFTVQLALAKNFLSMGILDRAETILLDLSQRSDPNKHSASALLLKVYEQERSWENAIKAVESLRRTKPEYYNNLLAHYLCELAQQDIRKSDRRSARKHLKQALSVDRNSVRANLILGQIEFDDGYIKQAVRTLAKINEQDPRRLLLAMPLLRKGYEQMGDLSGYTAFLRQALLKQPSTTITAEILSIESTRLNDPQAIEFITQQLYRHPTLRGLNDLIDLYRDDQHRLPDEALTLIYKLIQQIVEIKPVYCCESCGFSGRTMHWQCPSCHQWGSVHVIQSFEGD